MMQTIKDLLDAMNTDGGHMMVALILLFSGLALLVVSGLPEGKELFIFAMGILAKAMVSTGKANGKTQPPTPEAIP